MIAKGILTIILLMLVDPGDVSKINSAKSDAKKAYLAGDYKTASEKYTYLVDSLGVQEDEVYMNLANSYFQLNDTARAISSFQPLTMSRNPKLQSIANQQLGVLNNRTGKFEQALEYFKQALKANPANEDARFNYEMVKKKIEEEKKKQQQQGKDQQKKQDQQKEQENKEQQDKEKQDQQNKDQQKKDQQKKEQEEKEKKEQEEKEKSEKDKKEQEDKEKQEKEKKDIPPSVKEKLKDMDMSEEKAKMILEAMKNQEIQYLQQNKRKATKQRDKSKPDW
ncbi:MAG TPA: tetratricopeptide repeat protein [Cyclobacteriaceae bacterium]|nr:tetratricopeptide repeat protein [Cyclobacteriaceae bacterium]